MALKLSVISTPANLFMVLPKKAKGVESSKKTADKAKTVAKDSSEIDNLFSVLSTKKLPVHIEKATLKDKTDKKERKKIPRIPGDDVTLSDLEGLEEEGDGVQNVSEEEEEDDDERDNGTAYDPKKDDQFPATAIPADDSDFFDSRGLKRKSRALTDDGYPIYNPKELKIGMGGGTNLCPFDCNCCF